jgi:hypothetical protein
VTHDDDERHDNYCQTCGRALTRMTTADGVSYYHDGLARTDDHEIVRVPLREVKDPVMFCDFCGRPRPGWSYLCADVHVSYQEPTPRIVGESEEQYKGRYEGRVRIMTRREAERLGLLTPGTLGSSSGRWWAACDDCGDCLDRGDINGLIRQATDQFPARRKQGKHLVELRAYLRELYEPVFEAVTVKMPLGTSVEE